MYSLSARLQIPNNSAKNMGSPEYLLQVTTQKASKTNSSEWVFNLKL